MKIGILTLPLRNNYGGILQAYALMQTLKVMGHEVWLIDRQKNRIPKLKYPLVLIKRIIKKYVLSKQVVIFLEKKRKQKNEISNQYINEFINEYINPRTFKIYSSKELKKISKYHFDAIVIGSDQIWRPRYVPNIEDYFGGFILKSTKLIAYAASYGTDKIDYTPKQKEVCSKLIKRFNSISVREKDALDICSSTFNYENAEHVLDPTMLLDKSDYVSLFEDAGTQKNDGDLFVYILDKHENKNQIIDFVATKFNYTPFQINLVSNEINTSQIIDIAAPVEKWLRGIYDSKFIITDSFHATVFAILFNKPFIVYGNDERGLSRFYSILKMFELEKLLITTTVDIQDKLNAISLDIDWEKVNEILIDKKKISKMFLEQSLL